jgi:4-hydroxybutyrate CoA-transferase
MGWTQQYREKRTSAAEAVKIIESGMRVYIGAGCAVPQSLVDELVARGPQLQDVEIIHILTAGKAAYVDPEMAGHFRCNAMFVGPNLRPAVNEGRADYVPIHLHQIPDLLRADSHRADVAFVQVSPPDEHGFCSFGIEVGVTKPAAQAAKVIVAEINRQMPRTLGDSFMHISKFQACVEVDQQLATFPSPEISDVQVRIGENVASLVDDGACLQMGIGGIPESVLKFLHDKRDLGVHTEMFSEGLLDLMDSGVVTGERKTFHPGKVLAGFILGSQAIYDYVHDNALLEFHPTDYVNNPVNIARNDNMVAINAALQIDLTGQVCADSLGSYIYSGFGGQVDFMRGAAMSKGGKPITALPSTAKGGEYSRIVPLLTEGAGVVTNRADVHYVVTEYGIAPLFGQCVRKRAESLIDIAHPDFRQELRNAANNRKLFGNLG